MKAVILAGGMQSTVNDDYEGIPKPMAEIGEKPILWHIMKWLSFYGIKDFVVCGGYKISMLKDYFRDFYIYQSDITVDLQNNKVICHKNRTEDWHVTVVDTGLDTPPGKRLLQVRDYMGQEDFLVVHGDCVSNINVLDLVEFHQKNAKLLTLAVAKPTGRNTVLPLDEFGFYLENMQAELPQNQAWSDACCRIFKADIFPYLEKVPEIGQILFRQLADENQMISYFHDDFWCPMETKRDKIYLEKLWNTNEAPWRIWN